MWFFFFSKGTQMPLALLILSMAEQLLTLANRVRANNAQTWEMTPEEEALFDQRVAAIRSAPASDPEQNR
jgi:hypothetical protein